MRKIKTEKWEKEDILSSSDFEEMKFVIYLLENKITKVTINPKAKIYILR